MLTILDISVMICTADGQHFHTGLVSRSPICKKICSKQLFKVALHLPGKWPLEWLHVYS